MAHIQQQTQRPRMDRILLAALINGSAYGMLDLANPADPPADQAAPPMPVQMGPHNAERLLQGVTSDGDGVLHVAARLEDVKLVRAISQIWSRTDDVAAKNKRGETALHHAAATGNVDMVALLILMAPDNDKKRQLLRMRKHNGETCLHDAVRCGKMDTVKKLVQEDMRVVLGPDDGHALVKIHDNEGVSPLYLSTTLRQLEIVKFLTQQGPVGTYPAASYFGPGGKTALHAAVLLHKDLSKHLASWNNKELIDKADESGSTPLHLLASTKDKIIMELLLDLDPSAGYQADNEGSLPIHVAAATGSLEILKLLSEHCPSCSWSSDNFGQTILHGAVKNAKKSVVAYLCSGQKFTRIFNTRDTDGNTALHLAVLQGHQLIFCELMKRREVCLSFRNKEERTPLDLARLSLPQGLTKLTLPPGISLFKGPRHWIMQALVLAGADNGTCRSDRLTSNVAKPDKEEESKWIGKSAGLMAVCAVLILTTAFAAPFSVTDLYGKTTETFKARRVAYHIFVISDALAFGLSAIAVSCASLAGSSFVERGTRPFYLGVGVETLGFAAVFLILVFTSGLYVAVGPVVHARAFVIVSLLVSALPITLLLAPIVMMLLHVRALISRTGFPATYRRTQQSILPQWASASVPCFAARLPIVPPFIRRRLY